jgi:hypothetical protein
MKKAFLLGVVAECAIQQKIIDKFKETAVVADKAPTNY